jgi:hypothetical protein
MFSICFRWPNSLSAGEQPVAIAEQVRGITLSRFANAMAAIPLQSPPGRGTLRPFSAAFGSTDAMTTFFRRKSPIRALIAALAVLVAAPALADAASDLDARATAEYNRGLDARDAGQNAAACQHFRNAEALYHNSITSLAGMGYGHRSEEQLEAIKSFANSQQARVDGSKARAREVCGRPDGPALTNGNSGRAPVEDDYFAEKKALQRTSDLAHSQYKESVRLWESGNRAGACATIRQSTASFDKVSGAMKANPVLRSAFGNPDQVLANGKVAAETRDGTFCIDSAQKAELERTAVLAGEQYDEALRLWKAGDKPGACSAMRLSAASYAKALAAMNANPAFKAAFNEPEVVAENAAMAARIRDEMFCKG